MRSFDRAAKEARIAELREAIALLEAELEGAMQREQHDLIDRLEDHFDAVERKLDSLKLFWRELKADSTKPPGD